MRKAFKIEVDVDDTHVSCLNIKENQVDSQFHNYIVDKCPISYADIQSSMEHMFTIEDIKEYTDTTEFDETIQQIEELMDKFDCAYFRIIN